MTMNSNINQKAILSLSSLVHRFCQINPECIRIPEIKEIMTLLEAPIPPNCIATDTQTKNAILLALKGIGNAGTTTSLSLLQRCYGVSLYQLFLSLFDFLFYFIFLSRMKIYRPS